MRIFILLALFILCAPMAQAATCSLDKPAGNFAQCPKGGADNFLLGSGYNSAHLETNVYLSRTPIRAHGACAYVDARAITTPQFIPFNTSAEWQAFLTGHPAGVDIAHCCTPRPMRLSDIPKPGLVCSGGWQFVGLVEPGTSNVATAKIIAVATGTAPDDEIVPSAGAAD